MTKWSLEQNHEAWAQHVIYWYLKFNFTVFPMLWMWHGRLYIRIIFWEYLFHMYTQAPGHHDNNSNMKTIAKYFHVLVVSSVYFSDLNLSNSLRQSHWHFYYFTNPIPWDSALHNIDQKWHCRKNTTVREYFIRLIWLYSSSFLITYISHIYYITLNWYSVLVKI